jgi:hypothetical protein
MIEKLLTIDSCNSGAWNENLISGGMPSVCGMHTITVPLLHLLQCRPAGRLLHVNRYSDALIAFVLVTSILI